MAYLWTKDADDKEWAVSPLIGGAYGLSGRGLFLLDDDDCCHGGVAASVLMVRCGGGTPEQWCALGRKRASIQVNGAPLLLGVRLLYDRDELVIRADGASAALHCFFSSEKLAEVLPYPGGDGPVRCPRCKQPIERNQMAVRCPNAACGVWHHEEARLRCWTYAATCALCDQPTQLNAGFRWTPEQL
jgi:hypothetical protein